jgi:hypothetical protein
MIGMKAVVLDLISVVVPCIFFVACSIWWYMQHRVKGGKKDDKVYAALLITGSVTIFFAASLFWQIKAQNTLLSLSADNVTEVYVNGTRLTERQEVIAIVNSLHQAQWFTFVHGEQITPVALILEQRSGKKMKFAIGITQYQNAKGMLIEPIQEYLPTYLSDGLFYSDTLEQVLQQGHVSISSNKKKSGGAGLPQCESAISAPSR